MLEDDKAKAEKLAAAKKRVEEMKKKQAAKKKGGKKAGAGATAADDASEGPVSKGDKPTSSPPLEKEKEVPSLSEQSKMRSASFRGGNPPANALSPTGETAPDIYRKHVARIEELEKENKRLSQEASNATKRWEKAEEELAAKDEESSSEEDSDDEESGTVKKLKNEIAALQRQNSQLQSQPNRPRHASSASMSLAGPPPAEMDALLKSKTSQIESMELEISRLRAQLLKPPPTSENEQITALEEKLNRAETAAAKVQSELSDLRKSLDRTAEKAVREGSGRSSAETAAANAKREAESAKAERDEAVKKAEGLDKKVTAMVGLHKEQDSRMQALRKEKEALDREVDELRGRVSTLEKRLARHGGEGEKLGEGGGLDDEGMDELEAEERARLRHRIRDLEAENYDLRRGIWHDKRKNLQQGPEDHFQDVDLGGSGVRSPTQRKTGGGGLTDFFSSGLSAITGADEFQGTQQHGQFGSGGVAGKVGDDGLLDDDDLDFDEDAFKAAQQEEQGRRLERVKEAKRALNNWEGFRLDLVEARRGGGEGVGEIFEI
ncbi:hypothetical protein MKZ38_010526 [Zalerion maritima]|uniref:M protein repeat protein n=1 Tax=Zalerion maritima TaxID=339359 RepID=A0AAD5S0G4_9PEZI|nr:hypothetical protein MKZ38_010526 [Zalerion maritima]